MMTLENVSKSYGKKNVLNNINLTFHPGKIYGIAGENGAGKTTLFKCIAGLENFKGNVFYDRGKLKDKLGFLHTEPFFFAKITGSEYLQLLCNARNIPQQNLKEKNIFNLPLSEFAENYSTGMKKKLAITGILLQQNETFILDEPFNGVDIHSNILIKEIILKLKELNKTVLISSHIFSSLTDVCDMIILLKNGVAFKSAEIPDFPLIEQEMKGAGWGHKIDQLGLG